MSQPPRVYLDHNASSPLRVEAQEAMRMAMDPAIGNPSSLHTEGRTARGIVERARQQLAELVAVSTSEVVFTSGGSEAIAAAVPPARASASAIVLSSFLFIIFVVTLELESAWTP